MLQSGGLAITRSISIASWSGWIRKPHKLNVPCVVENGNSRNKISSRLVGSSHLKLPSLLWFHDAKYDQGTTLLSAVYRVNRADVHIYIYINVSIYIFKGLCFLTNFAEPEFCRIRILIVNHVLSQGLLWIHFHSSLLKISPFCIA